MAAFIVIWWFISAMKMGKTCRIVTTSVKEEHLNVLWGEIGRFLSTSTVKLMHREGGPLVVNHQEIRRFDEMESKNPLNYVRGQVSAHGEGLAGHHSEASLFVCDEFSGVEDTSYEMAQGWMKRCLIFGNPHPPRNQYFQKMVEEGDIAE